MPGGPISVESKYLPESEFKKREENIRRIMVERGLDALFIYGDEYRYGDYVYIANYKGLNIVEEAPYYIFFPLEGDSIMFTGRFNIQPATKHSRIEDVRCLWDLEQHIKDIARLNLKKIGAVGVDITPYPTYETTAKGLPNVKMEEANEIIQQLRLRKSDNEVKLMRKAGEVADAGMRAGREVLVEGNTEWEVLARAEDACRRLGGDNPFSNMMGSGESLTDRVFLASDNKLREGVLACVGLHPNFRYYCNDTERTWPIGKVSDEQLNALKAANRIMEEEIDYIAPGRTWLELVEHYRELIDREGYLKYWASYEEEVRGHALGHGIGLDMVEWPRRYPRDWNIKMEPNMTVAIKSEMHGFSWGGIRQESVVLVTKSGSEALNKVEYI